MDHGFRSHKAHDFAYDNIRHLRHHFSAQCTLGEDNVAEAIGMGSIMVGVEFSQCTTISRITDVLHMPKLQSNLLSIRKFLSKGLKVRLHVNVLWEVPTAMWLP